MKIKLGNYIFSKGIPSDFGENHLVYLREAPRAVGTNISVASHLEHLEQGGTIVIFCVWRQLLQDCLSGCVKFVQSFTGRWKSSVPKQQ